jgi:hypothetical protein
VAAAQRDQGGFGGWVSSSPFGRPVEVGRVQHEAVVASAEALSAFAAAAVTSGHAAHRGFRR